MTEMLTSLPGDIDQPAGKWQWLMGKYWNLSLNSWKRISAEQPYAGFCFGEPGVFLYSGFGMGLYLAKSGLAKWCWTTEAVRLAKEEGLTYRYIDTFDIREER
mgnify:CR=1 FL=1